MSCKACLSSRTSGRLSGVKDKPNSNLWAVSSLGKRQCAYNFGQDQTLISLPLTYLINMQAPFQRLAAPPMASHSASPVPRGPNMAPKLPPLPKPALDSGDLSLVLEPEPLRHAELAVEEYVKQERDVRLDTGVCD